MRLYLSPWWDLLLAVMLVWLEMKEINFKFRDDPARVTFFGYCLIYAWCLVTLCDCVFSFGKAWGNVLSELL
jgi:hypothetical protein